MTRLKGTNAASSVTGQTLKKAGEVVGTVPPPPGIPRLLRLPEMSFSTPLIVSTRPLNLLERLRSTSPSKTLLMMAVV